MFSPRQVRLLASSSSSFSSCATVVDVARRVFVSVALCFVLVCLAQPRRLVRCSTEEEKLIKNLLKGYNRLIRPVRNSSEFVTVTVDLSLVQLINVVSNA